MNRQKAQQFFSSWNQLFVQLFPPPSWVRQLPLIYTAAEPGLCGIGCVAMVLKSLRATTSPRAMDIDDLSVAVLAKKYQSKRRFYLDQVGWTHEGLVTVLAEYGSSAATFKWKTVRWLLNQLHRRHYVIVSLRVPPVENLSDTSLYQPIDSSKPPTNHLCLIYGYRHGNLLMADPRHIGRYSLVELPLREFARLFAGSGVVVSV